MTPSLTKRHVCVRVRLYPNGGPAPMGAQSNPSSNRLRRRTWRQRHHRLQRGLLRRQHNSSVRDPERVWILYSSGGKQRHRHRLCGCLLWVSYPRPLRCLLQRDHRCDLRRLSRRVWCLQRDQQHLPRLQWGAKRTRPARLRRCVQRHGHGQFLRPVRGRQHDESPRFRGGLCGDLFWGRHYRRLRQLHGGHDRAAYQWRKRHMRHLLWERDKLSRLQRCPQRPCQARRLRGLRGHQHHLPGLQWDTERDSGHRRLWRLLQRDDRRGLQ